MNINRVIFTTMLLLLPSVPSAAITLEAETDVWLRERTGDGVFEDDLVSVWNSQVTTQFEQPPLSRRYGVIEFDLSSLSGVDITIASLRLWGGATGFSDAEAAIKQSAVAIDTSTGTPTASLTWNAYNAEYAGSATALEGLGSYDLATPTATEVFFDSAATGADLTFLESVADGTFASNQKLTLVMIAAEEGPDIAYAHSWGDGPDGLGGFNAELVINEIPPEDVELTLEVNTTTGGVLLKNPGVDPAENSIFDIDGYVISSPAGELTPSSFAGQTGAGLGNWEIIDPTTTALSELNISSSTEYEEGDTTYLGRGYTPGADEDPNLSFFYTLAEGGTFEGDIAFTEELAGDFNGNNVVDSADYAIWLANLGKTDASAADGDADGNRTVNLVDYRIWRDNLGLSTSLGIVSGQSGEVPEPSAWMICWLVFVANLVGMRERKC